MERTAWPKFKRHHLHLNAIECRYFKQQKTGKTSSRFQKSKVWKYY